MTEVDASVVSREDVDALARLIADREMVGRGSMPFDDTSWARSGKREWIQAAEAILASSWLAAHDEGVRAAERERLAADEEPGGVSLGRIHNRLAEAEALDWSGFWVDGDDDE